MYIMENVKKEELEKLVGIDKANVFYDIVSEITKRYVHFISREYIRFYDYLW